MSNADKTVPMAQALKKGDVMKDWPAATSDPKDSAMIGGVANGRPLTRNGKKTSDEPLEVTIEKGEEASQPDKGMNKFPGRERHYDENGEYPEPPSQMGEVIKGVAHYHKRP